MNQLTTLAQDAKRDHKTVLINFKASPNERDKYLALAEDLELSLSAIIRMVLNQACVDAATQREEVGDSFHN